MRAGLVMIGVVFAGCTQTVQPSVAPAAGLAPNGAQQAYFTQYPEGLFTAAALTCDGPGQSVVQPSADEVRCESLPDPESAAALILQFEGSIEDLPKFVISFSGRETELGYLVTADNYIRVPRRVGDVQLIRFPDPQVENDVKDLLAAAGGRPL